MREFLTQGSSFRGHSVVRLLGKGGMGEVWLLKSSTGEFLAAKILDPGREGKAESRSRFHREARLALGMKHTNLVETYEVGEDAESGHSYILMEYVPGGTLEERLEKRGSLSVADAVSVVRAIANALELGRRKGIVHRDIKPANIMFAADGTPKLADFGIARGMAGGEMTTVTQEGAMIGTPAYMAPEQMLDAHHVDTRADIYSLGVVFFEMLTGIRPNKDDTVVQLMARAVKGEPLPDVRTLRPEVSASLAQLLNMMVVPDKDGRISTPGQITNALAIIERGGELSNSKLRLSRRAGIARAVVAVLALAAAAVAWRSRRATASDGASKAVPAVAPVRVPPALPSPPDDDDGTFGVQKVVDYCFLVRGACDSTAEAIAMVHALDGAHREFSFEKMQLTADRHGFEGEMTVEGLRGKLPEVVQAIDGYLKRKKIESAVRKWSVRRLR